MWLIRSIRLFIVCSACALSAPCVCFVFGVVYAVFVCVVFAACGGCGVFCAVCVVCLVCGAVLLYVNVVCC